MVPPNDLFRPQARSLFISQRMTPLELRDHLPKWHDDLSDQTATETAGEIPFGARRGYGLDFGVLTSADRGAKDSERHHGQTKISSSVLDQKLGSQTVKTPVHIKAVGVGNGGCNTVMRLMEQPVPGMSYSPVDTDGIRMEADDQVDVIQIAANKEQSWCSPKVHQAECGFFDQFGDSLRNSLAGADLVFITAGMGGGAGTSVAPHIAQLAKQQGALVAALVPLRSGSKGVGELV